MPPVELPLPRFVAEPPHELEPYGRWAEELGRRFQAACEAVDDYERIAPAGEPVWFPERTLAGRTYVPATAPAADGHELFGYVSFRRGAEGGRSGDFEAYADFTDETAAANPDWRLDLNDAVLLPWRGPGEATGDLALVWGSALAAGGSVATAELGEHTLDQCALVQSERFTLVTLDALHDVGEDLYLEVVLWDKRGGRVASESVYETGEDE